MRLFNLALETLYPHCRKRMTLWAFLSEMYKTLGLHSGKPKGLFQDFDPNRYKGTLTLASHFTNLFKGRLRANIQRALASKDDERRCESPEKYRGHRYTSRPASLKWELESTLPEMFARLGESERTIIRLRYWEGQSNRQIGERLGIDHKTVRRRHDAAVERLREFFEDALRGRAA
jgi:RNA polymerase sigma factor (sigma-70 family)